MHIKAILIFLVLFTGASCAGRATSSVMQVLELATHPDTFNGEIIEVSGVVCDGIETSSFSLQPGPTCKDMAGITLEFDRNNSRPQLGSSVVVVGRFVDNSRARSDTLNYRDNRYLGNFVIAVRTFKALVDGPNNSFKPKPLRGSA